MPIYNTDKYLEESIKSLLAQTYKNFEIIIVDDSSIDDSYKIALKFSKKDNRIIVIKNKNEKGIYGALNTGLSIASGEFIARADGDDICKSYRLEKQIKFFNENNDINIIGGGYELFGNNQNRKIFHPKNSLVLAWKFLSNTHFCHPSVMFRSLILKDSKNYPKEDCEDFAYFSEIIKKNKGSNIKKILIEYRQHNNNYSKEKELSIKKSVLNTFNKNYLFYFESLENSEIFYDFHANYKLELKNLLKIIKISNIISKKILDNYKIKKTKIVILHITILIHILKSICFTFIKKLQQLIKKG
jgi:glycosyltransferase involved in cell wall biosynthesis